MKILTTFLVAFCIAACAQRKPAPMVTTSVPTWDGSIMSEQQSRYEPVVSTGGMVVSDSREASEWGAKVLKAGGNAIDAAVATAFALAVMRPHYASIGGGGFLVYCPHPTEKGPQPCITLDYRETAPSAAWRDMYLREGKARTDLSQNGALASGVPGVVAGLLTTLEKYGTMSRASLMAKPIELAKKGVPMTARMESAAEERKKALNSEAKKLFGRVDMKGEWMPQPPGNIIKQPELAKVLEEISKKGKDGFYSGWVAQKIVDGLQSAGGVMTLDDLKKYEPKFRTPLTTQLGKMEVVTMPPPSAGGAVLVQLLTYAQRADAQGELAEGFGSVRTIHAITHAMKLAYADRAKYFGDPDFVKVPLDKLLSSEYVDDRWKTFNPEKAVAVSEPIPVADEKDKSLQFQYTTHFSVIDGKGNAVAITTTVNDYYGSGFVPPGTGIVMNDEMDDFSIQPGVPNMFGLVGTEANAIAPGKRPLSSMTPTIVRDSEGNARVVIGAAGGPRITTAVFLSLMNRLRFGMSLIDAVAAPRFHHQWRPDELRFEREGIAPEIKQDLIKKGYTLVEIPSSAKVHALERFPNGRTWSAQEFRGEGAAVGE